MHYFFDFVLSSRCTLSFQNKRTCNGPEYSNQYLISSGGVSSNSFLRATKSSISFFIYEGTRFSPSCCKRRRCCEYCCCADVSPPADLDSHCREAEIHSAAATTNFSVIHNLDCRWEAILCDASTAVDITLKAQGCCRSEV
jgi:hypothetical protein